MFQQLSSLTYLSLTMINTIIGIIGTFSLGLIHDQSKLNCPFIIFDYPGNVSLQMDHCHLYESSLKLIKLVIILSACYNVYLIHIFFCYVTTDFHFGNVTKLCLLADLLERGKIRSFSQYALSII